ncbi:MAG: response regulator [Kiloniellales bacterium]|nr:response regulator [Kiloniellales bacterium]
MLQENWNRLTVLIVDDNRFVRSLLESVMRSFGIERLVAVEDASVAIKRLKLSKIDPISAQLGTVDIILSDYLMPSVDGGLFLRWIRTGEGVPDRFVPFIMVSGAADREVVEQARDAGVTEFLAKPFSAKSIAERILHVINNPRQFILTRGYFGPDRRRTEQPVEVERRITQAGQIQVVHREANVTALRDDVRAIHFRPANKLKDKVGSNALKGEIDIDPIIIQAAETKIQSMLGDYSDWVQKSLEAMTEASDSLQIETEHGDVNRKYIAQINKIAHELRGQGGIFNYPLTTALGKSLYRTTMDFGMIMTENRIKLIRAHIDGIRSVFHNKIRGDGGEVGAALLKEIATAVKRYSEPGGEDKAGATAAAGR